LSFCLDDYNASRILFLALHFHGMVKNRCIQYARWEFYFHIKFLCI
jgi:hypothetical protein